ncbi:MAG TPA: GNAT family N-acetyltransferase [Thermomicrobiales bacterium]|nr:GNAT family N-acetyltransferase [Thermomicrobiales bacterium]
MSEERDHRVAAALAGVAMPAGIAIRAFEEGDFPAIQDLSSAEGWPTPATRPGEALAAWRRSWPALVAVEGEAVAGFVRALSDGEVTTYVAEILVAPAWRGRGVGRALLDACHALTPHTRIDLLATATSGPFYAAHGFRPMPGYRRSVRPI